MGGADRLDAVDGDDVGVVERRHRLGLAAEALDPFRVVGHLRRQDFERYIAVELRILGPIDDTHAALTDDLHDPVPSQHFSDHARSSISPPST